MQSIIKNMVEIFGIVYFRFRLLPRLWCVWLVAVNAACLLYIDHIEAQVVLAVTLVSVVAQSIIYQLNGFTRILGIVHVLWIPMFIWMASRSESITNHPELTTWLSVLFLTNLLSMIIDTVDVTRFLKGERSPHYYWNTPTLQI